MSLPPVIERGVPIPPKDTSSGPRLSLTRALHALDVGECARPEIGTTRRQVETALQSVRHYFKGARKFTYRTNRSTGRVRIWRTK